MSKIDTTTRVFRGGSWVNSGALLRIALRYRLDPSLHFGDLGFRLVEEIDDTENKPDTLYRVDRGGSWCDSAADLRVAYHCEYDPSRRYDNLGFRLVEEFEDE